jgi:hypothetical protein
MPLICHIRSMMHGSFCTSEVAPTGAKHVICDAAPLKETCRHAPPVVVKFMPEINFALPILFVFPALTSHLRIEPLRKMAQTMSAEANA